MKYNSPEELAMVNRANAIIDACYGVERAQRTDGYQNVLTRYGTKNDSSTAYSFTAEASVDDYTLGIHYQFNGLFSKIIDLPAQEAVSKGFKLNINNKEDEALIMKILSYIGAVESIETALKWSRLFGGALSVMLIDDGRGIDEPLNFKAIRGIDEIKVYEAPIVSPIVYKDSNIYAPDLFQVSSVEGTFIVHASRCLIFRNGKLPQIVSDWRQNTFGAPEYDRIKRVLQETVTTHSYAPKMLERAIQSVLSIKDLSQLLASEQGEDIVLQRLNVIDMARSLFNSIAIDADGESYDFKSAPFTGVKEIIDSTCNMLSAVTNIPQALLFGSSPQGMDATGQSDLENYYNYIEQIQKRIVKAPLTTLIDIVIQSLVRTGKLKDYPEYELVFNSLWSLSEAEKSTIDQTNMNSKLVKAQTAQLYVDMGALDPSEVRVALSKDGEYDVETILDDVSDEDLFSSILDNSSDEPVPSNAQKNESFESDSNDDVMAAAVIVVDKSGRILFGERTDNGLFCGPGGHIESGETPIQAAIRETQEEFGIAPLSLYPLGIFGENADGFHKTQVFVCKDYEGTVSSDGKEIRLAHFLPLNVLLNDNFTQLLFTPFKNSLLSYQKTAQTGQEFYVENPNESGIINNDDFEESDHPRDKDGKFSTANSSSSEGSSEAESSESVTVTSDSEEITHFKTVGKVMKITSDIKLKSKKGKIVGHIKSGKKIEGIYPFAGKGSENVLVMAGTISHRFGGASGNWSHKCGYADVLFLDGKEERKEIHWFENEEVGQYRFRIKVNKEGE